MSIRKSDASKKRKKKPPSKTSRKIRKVWDETLDKTGIRKLIRKLDTLAEWDEPQNLNESLTADVISGIPFIGLRRAISQFRKNKNVTNVFDGVAEFWTITGSTVAMIFPSNTIIYTKKKYLSKTQQEKLKYI